MKTVLLIIVINCLSITLFSQNHPTDDYQRRYSITIGILQGGGSLVGADLEVLLTKRLGIQIGAGYVGFGGGLNYHFKPSVRSSFLSFQYWHQGFGDSYTQSVLGPNFVFRGKNGLLSKSDSVFLLRKDRHGPILLSSLLLC